MEWAVSNLNRLKQLWSLCHPNVPMKWFSMDQKPSYFNNAAATGTYGKKGQAAEVREKFAASRERYTICTTVQAETREDGLPAKDDEEPMLIDDDSDEEHPPDGLDSDDEPPEAPLGFSDLELEEFDKGPVAPPVKREPPAPPVQMEPPPPPAKHIPKFAVMFKGTKHGTIEKRLKELDNPDWLLIQVQEYGSYRSEDVVEALNWMLPGANNPTESMVVLLDWYSGHRTDEVRDLIRKKGHVLVFHGGGTTPFTQTNDTHLHALVQWLLVKLENRWALSQKEFQREHGLDVTPKPTREAILHMCTLMWQGIDHDDTARKAYRATGPGLPLRGPIEREAVGKELVKVWDAIDPGEIAGDLGTEIRDREIKFINDGWNKGLWTSWSHAYRVIEEHDDDERPVEEGLEGFEYDEDDDEEDDDGDDGPPGDAGGAPPKDDGGKPPDCDDKGDGPPGDRGSQPGGNADGDVDGQDDGDGDGRGGDGAGGGGPQGPSNGGNPEPEDGGALVEWSGPCAPSPATPEYIPVDGLPASEQSPKRRRGLPASERTRGALGPPTEAHAGSAVAAFQQSVGLPDMDLASIEAQARQVMITKATRERDDATLKRLLANGKKESLKEKQSRTEIARILIQKANADNEALEERRKENAEIARQKALELEDRKAEASRLQFAADAKRIERLAKAIEDRRDGQRRAEQALREKAEARWLQVDFPVLLARRCIDWYTQAPSQEKRELSTRLEGLFRDQVFKRRPLTRDLWIPVKEFTSNWAQLVVREGHDRRISGTPHWVRCSAAFNAIIEECLGDGPVVGQRHPPSCLEKVFRRILGPSVALIIGSKSLTSSEFLLFHNDCIMEKAFCHGIILLSLWLGEELFEPGVYGNWPPKAPSQLHAAVPTIHLDCAP